MLIQIDIYQSDQATKAYTYLSTTRNNVFNVFSAIDNDIHRAKRKLVGQAVSERAMRAFEPSMMDCIDIYLRQILEAAKDDQPVNMTEKSRHLGLDIVGQLAFGYDLACQTQPDNHFIMKAMYFGNFRGNVYHHIPALAKLYVNRIFDYIFYEARKKYWRLLKEWSRHVCRCTRTPGPTFILLSQTLSRPTLTVSAAETFGWRLCSS